MKGKEKGGQPSKRALNAWFWLLLLLLAGQVSGAHSGWRTPGTGWAMLQGGGGLGWLEKFTVPLCWSASCKPPGESTQGTVPKVPGWRETGRTFPVTSHFCRSALGCRSLCLPCNDDNSWISCEFLTAALMHLNGNLRRSTLCPRWLTQIRTKPVTQSHGRIEPSRE